MIKRFCDIDETQIHDGEQYWSIEVALEDSGDSRIRVQPQGNDFKNMGTNSWVPISNSDRMVCRKCAMAIAGLIATRREMKNNVHSD